MPAKVLLSSSLAEFIPMTIGTPYRVQFAIELIKIFNIQQATNPRLNDQSGRNAQLIALNLNIEH